MSTRGVPGIDPFGRGFCFNFYMGELMRRWFAMECSGGVGVWLPMGDDSRLIGVATERFACSAWGSCDIMAWVGIWVCAIGVGGSRFVA